MTPERFKLLDDLGFKWSSPTPARARRNKATPKKADGSSSEEQKEAAPEVKAENGAPAEDGKAADPAQAEAMTAATDVVGDLPAAEAGANEEKAEAPAEVPVENDAPVVTV